MALGRTFTFLAMSDLRIGSEDWGPERRPDAEFLRKLVEDIRRASQSLPTIDAIILAGDIANTGQAEEYEICSGMLRELFDSLFAIGPAAEVVVPVPGNHDMNWHRGLIDGLTEYRAWAPEWAPPEARTGQIAGDVYVDVQGWGGGVGIIGVNTDPSWRIAQERINSLLEGSLHKWSQNRLHVLVGRHPPSSFDRDAAAIFLDPNMFHLHICGHSHERWPWPIGSRTAPAVIQCPSLCPGPSAETGYVIGTVNLERPSSLTLVSRKYLQGRQSWRPAHLLRETFQVELPSAGRGASVQKYKPLAVDSPIYVESVSLNGFRTFEQIAVQFRRESTLAGEWTCIAGINGAGKSSLLQALALALLGDPWITELGGERLNRMRRFVGGERRAAAISCTLTLAETSRRVTVKIDIDTDGAVRAYCDPDDFWQQLRASRVVVAYGASRNLSSRPESGSENLSADVRRVLTLFDPLTQLASAEVLLRETASNESVLPLFRNLIEQVFGGELTVDTDGPGLRFRVTGVDDVEAMDLPDGFRASAAWMADLCAAWAAKAPELAKSGNPADIQAIVLIDEIDLHLHPALQRSLVPKLRAALPYVQWIVSTHSPLVLGSFDSKEIIVLDRAQPGNVRELDRQILGFSADQIYAWLMGTEPNGAAIEEILEKEDAENPSSDTVAELLTVSPTLSEAEAKAKIRDMKDAIKRLRS